MITQLKKYGPVNSIVLSRAAGADNVYLQDEESVELDGLCEIKIADNQIMNWNDRSDYLPDILRQLNGLEYYLNDYSSTGIFYYNVCDKYNVSIDNNSYPCVMFNDEINITQGAEEIVYTDMPEETETDYTKSDKTDRKLNQTYLIVDKQNQTITSLVNEVDTYSERITEVEQTVDTISQQVSDLENLTHEATGRSVIHLENAYPSNILNLTITNSFSLLFPQNSLYPSNNIYPLDSYLIIDKTETLSEDAIKLHLPITHLDNGEKLVIENGRIKVIHINNTETDLGEFNIELFEGDNYIYLESFKENNINYYAKYAVKSEYTDIFATKVEMNSSITQTAQEINLEVSKKVDENEVVSVINQSAEQITLKSNRLVVESDGFTLDGEGNMTATSGEIGGFSIKSNELTTNVKDKYTYTNDDATRASNIANGSIQPTDEDYDKYDLDRNGTIDKNDTLKILRKIRGYAATEGSFSISTEDVNAVIKTTSNITAIDSLSTQIGLTNITTDTITVNRINGKDAEFENLTVTGTFNNSSDKRSKKDIQELSDNYINIVKELKPVSFKYKKNDVKRLGFIAQDLEKILINNNIETTPISVDEFGMYSINYLDLIAILWKDNQKLHEEIDKLKEMIKHA